MNLLEALKLADICSLINALLGFLALLISWGGRSDLAVVLVLAAASVDGLDGFASRRLGRGRLGGDLDSLAALVSFGIAPLAIAYSAYEGLWTVGAAGCPYIVAAILRLARFNVSPTSAALFEGLPITGAGVMVAISILFRWPLLTMLLLILLSLLMVSAVPYPKVRSPGAIILVVSVLILAAAIGCILGDVYRSGQVLFIAISAYLAYPVVRQFQQNER